MDELVDETDEGARARRGSTPGSIATELYVQMAYSGQNSDMSVPVPEGPALDANGLLDLAAALPRPARVRPRVRVPQPAADKCAACA